MNKKITIQNGDAMSGNEPTGARRRRKTKVAVWLGLAGLSATTAALAPIGSHTQAAPTGPIGEGMVCTNDATPADHAAAFSLTASDGYTSEPDGNAIYDWGYGLQGSGFQLPGPVLCVNKGDVVTITLTNQLKVPTSIQFPGQENVQYTNDSGSGPVGPMAVAGNLTSLVPGADPTKTVTYTFTATHEGTYLYESGTDPQLQVQMGLFGAIVVRSNIAVTGADIMAIPFDDGAAAGETNGTNSVHNMDAGYANSIAGAAKCAYGKIDDPATTTVDESTQCDPLAIYGGDAEDENILMLSEVDPGVHTFMEQNLANTGKLNWNAYPNAYEAHYFMINGRSMPDTIAPNYAPWLPSQPYGALATVQPWSISNNPLDILLRYVAVGVTGYDFHPHSNHEHVIAEDGALMKGSIPGHDNTEEKFNIMVAPGSTVDATFRWTNEEDYTSAGNHRVPVAWPQGLNLQEGDFWSGSPYLGESGLLNPGILTKTQCGEYYHVAHSHDLTQVTNYGITFGGMLTLIKVEPPASVGSC